MYDVSQCHSGYGSSPSRRSSSAENSDGLFEEIDEEDENKEQDDVEEHEEQETQDTEIGQGSPEYEGEGYQYEWV